MKNKNKRNNHQKRVAIISVHGDPLARLGGHETGGQNVYVLEISKHLARKGWLVDVFTRLMRKRKKMVRSYGKNVRLIYLKAGPRYFIPKEQAFKQLPEFVGNFLAFKAENKLHYNILHGNYYLSGWVVAQLKRILRVPMVETFHSLGYIKYHTLERFGKENIDTEQFQARIRAEKEIMEAADKIIATSPPEKRDILQYYNFDLESKIEIIPCGVNIKRFRKVSFERAREHIRMPKFSLEDQIILYVGRLDWRKGIESLIKAFPLVLKKLSKMRKHLKIVIIGGKIGKRGDKADKKEFHRLENIAKGLKLEDKILFLGRRDQEKLRYYYSSANVCVIPSYYEPFGMTALEAMHCNVPVIASKIGGLAHTIKDGKTGLLFPRGKERMLSNRIVKVLKKKKLRNRLQNNAYPMVKEKFSWQKIACQISKLYQQLMQ